jgi:hypothetical protein
MYPDSSVSLAVTRALVFGALGAASVASLLIIGLAIFLTHRRRRDRWPWWATPLQIVITFLAGWFWLYPAFQTGAILGWALGSQLGGGLTPLADVVVMAVMIGVCVLALYAAPVFLLVIGLATALNMLCGARRHRDEAQTPSHGRVNGCAGVAHRGNSEAVPS